MNLRDAMEGVRSQCGDLTPKAVVDVARKQRNEVGRYLHAHLEWDDKVAGEKYRHVQAQDLIQRVVTIRQHPETGVTIRVRAYIAIDHPDRGNVYEPLDEVLDDPMSTEIALMSMEREWKGLWRRAQQFEELVKLVKSDVLAVTV